MDHVYWFEVAGFWEIQSILWNLDPLSHKITDPELQNTHRSQQQRKLRDIAARQIAPLSLLFASGCAQPERLLVSATLEAHPFT